MEATEGKRCRETPRHSEDGVVVGLQRQFAMIFDDPTAWVSGGFVLKSETEPLGWLRRWWTEWRVDLRSRGCRLGQKRRVVCTGIQKSQSQPPPMLVIVRGVSQVRDLGRRSPSSGSCNRSAAKQAGGEARSRDSQSVIAQMLRDTGSHKKARWLI